MDQDSAFMCHPDELLFKSLKHKIKTVAPCNHQS